MRIMGEQLLVDVPFRDSFDEPVRAGLVPVCFFLLVGNGRMRILDRNGFEGYEMLGAERLKLNDRKAIVQQLAFALSVVSHRGRSLNSKISQIRRNSSETEQKGSYTRGRVPCEESPAGEFSDGHGKCRDRTLRVVAGGLQTDGEARSCFRAWRPMSFVAAEHAVAPLEGTGARTAFRRFRPGRFVAETCGPRRGRRKRKPGPGCQGRSSPRRLCSARVSSIG